METQPDPSFRPIRWKVNLGIHCDVLSGFCWERGRGGQEGELGREMLGNMGSRPGVFRRPSSLSSGDNALLASEAGVQR